MRDRNHLLADALVIGLFAGVFWLFGFEVFVVAALLNITLLLLRGDLE